MKDFRDYLAEAQRTKADEHKKKYGNDEAPREKFSNWKDWLEKEMNDPDLDFKEFLNQEVDDEITLASAMDAAWDESPAMAKEYFNSLKRLKYPMKNKIEEKPQENKKLGKEHLGYLDGRQQPGRQYDT